MPYTQLPFLRYLASLPYEQLIIVDLRHPLEDTEPRKVHARYWEAITAEPDDLEDVLYDNMDDKAEWKAYHQDWLRVKKGGKKGAEHDAIGQVGLDLAAQQIRTGAPVEAKAKGDKAAQSKSEGETAVPHECGGTPSQDRVTAHPPGSSVASPAASMAITENGVAPAEARIKHRRSMQSDFRSGYIGRTYVDHVRFMRWYDGCAVERDDRARLMNMVLQALVPCAEQSMRMKTADEAAKVGIVIHW